MATRRAFLQKQYDIAKENSILAWIPSFGLKGDFLVSEFSNMPKDKLYYSLKFDYLSSIFSLLTNKFLIIISQCRQYFSYG
jgi:hypothetical protein